MSKDTLIHYQVPLKYFLKKNKGSRSLKISTNKIYAGIHWGQRKSIKDRIYDTAERFCRPIQAIESYPVEISYRFIFGTRPLDTLNTAYMAKMFEDSLRALGVIKDDTPRYVKKSSLEIIVVSPQERKEMEKSSGIQANAADYDILEIIITPILQNDKSTKKIIESCWKATKEILPDR